MADAQPALPEGPRSRTFKPVSDTPTREEFDARLREADARSDVRFERLAGEFRASNEALRGEMRASNEEFRGQMERLSEQVGGLARAVDAVQASQLATRWGLGGLIIAAIAVVIALFAYGKQKFDTGLQSSDILAAAAQRGAERALAARADTSTPAVSTGQQSAPGPR